MQWQSGIMTINLAYHAQRTPWTIRSGLAGKGPCFITRVGELVIPAVIRGARPFYSATDESFIANNSFESVQKLTSGISFYHEPLRSVAQSCPYYASVVVLSQEEYFGVGNQLA